jgi:alkylation response protein AidB-like acyl-CoA dehydrogenase
MFSRSYDDVLAWARSTRLPDGRRVVDQEWVQVNLARVRAQLDVLTLLNWKVAASEGANPADASATKVFGTEFFVEGYRLLMEILGPAAAFDRGSPGALLAGRLSRGFQGTLILTFGGGVNEIQRDLIALFGLGLPRVPRT